MSFLPFESHHPPLTTAHANTHTRVTRALPLQNFLICLEAAALGVMFYVGFSAAPFVAMVENEVNTHHWLAKEIAIPEPQLEDFYDDDDDRDDVDVEAASESKAGEENSGAGGGESAAVSSAPGTAFPAVASTPEDASTGHGVGGDAVMVEVTDAAGMFLVPASRRPPSPL